MVEESALLQLSSFGGFSIAAVSSERRDLVYTEISCSGQSSKAYLLIEYLLLSGRESATFEELIELLWPAGGLSDPLASLRLMVHRARTELDKLGIHSGAEMILRQEGSYSWNKAIPVHSDVAGFEMLYEQSRRGSAAVRLEKLLELTRLYKGRFLPRISSQQWAMILDTYYHSKYLLACEEAVALLAAAGRTEDIIALCKQAVALDPFAEKLHIAFMRALIDTGAYGSASEYYRSVSRMFAEELGVEISGEMKAVHNEMQRTINGPEENLWAIRQALDDGGSEGAFFVEYEAFKFIYQLKSRENERSGQAVQLALISALPAAGKHPGQRAAKTCMDRLGDSIRGSLRQGDLFTRYSDRQYLLFLQSASSENCRLALERVERSFKAAYPRSGFLLQCSALPILPKKHASGE